MTTSLDSPPLTIALLGTFGQHNIGDDLLLDTFLTQLGPQHRYLINSYDPNSTRRRVGDRFDVEIVDTASGRFKFLRRLRRADHLVFAGGSIIKELYPSVGRNRYATLIMVLGVVTFARRVAHVPISMCHVGIGPIDARLGRFLARLILRQVDQLTVRDTASFNLARSMGVDPHAVELAPDAVLVNPPTAFVDRIAPVALNSRGVIRVGLNLNFDIANGDNWSYFLDRLEQSLRCAAATHRMEFHLFPMQSEFKPHHDLEVLEDFGRRLSPAPVVVHHTRDQRDVGAVIAHCDVIVAERLHAIVIAAILGRPSLVLAYDVKVAELARTLQLQQVTTDINQHFDADRLTTQLHYLIANADAMGANLARRCEELRIDAQQRIDQLRNVVCGAPISPFPSIDVQPVPTQPAA